MRLNPYRTGNPVKGEAFIGRADIFREVMQILRHPHSHAIVLYGQRRIGKTSVLRELETQLHNQSGYTPVYMDLQDKARLPLGELLYGLGQRINDALGLPFPERALFDEAGDYFRHTYLPQAAAQAKGQGLVLLFDEFDVMDNRKQEQAGQSFFPYLRAWLEEVSKVKFVFVIGRRPEDLSSNTLATFKAMRHLKVGLFSPEDGEEVIRQSEKGGGLHWGADGVEAVWQWTQGHPLLTQLLCSVVWERVYVNGQEPNPLPAVSADMVSAAVDRTIQQAENIFRWVWDGLPPAERIVTAAMASAEKEVLTLDDIERILTQSGVRLIVRQLEVAPKTLGDWDLLQPVAGGYRFTVNLWRQWVRRHHPLSQVKEELDRLDPLADSLYKSGLGFYGLQQWGNVETPLRQALAINPNHLQAQLLLGKFLLEQGRYPEAVEILERVYAYDHTTRADLVRALLALAEQPSETDPIAIYERILQISPHHRGANQYLAEVKEQQRHQHLNGLRLQAETLTKAEDWPALLMVCEEWAQLAPDDQEIRAKLAYARTETTFWQTYNEAVELIQEGGDPTKAQQLLVEVIRQRPGYREAGRYLLIATKGVDVNDLLAQLSALQTKIEGLNDELKREATQKRRLERSVLDLNQKMEALKQELEGKRQQIATAQDWEKANARKTEMQALQIKNLESQLADLRKLLPQAELPPPPAPHQDEAPRQPVAGNLTKLAEKQLNDPRTKPITLSVIEPAVSTFQPIIPLLSPWNPFDYMLLFIWLFFDPQGLKTYKKAHGAKAIFPVGNWLASTLIWWPLFVVMLGLALGSVPSATALSGSTYGWLAGGLVVAWAWMGWLEDGDHGCAVLVAAVVAGGVVGVADGVAFWVAGGVVGVVAVRVAAELAGGLVVGVAAVVAGGVGGVVGVAFWVAFVVADGVADGVALMVALMVAFMVALVVASGVAVGAKNGRPNFITITSGLALIAAYAFLIWFSFLGGAAYLSG